MRPALAQRRGALPVWAAFATLALHVGLLGGLLVAARLGPGGPPRPMKYVDAQLVRFGHPRDLSFLPHKEGQVKPKVPPPEIKVAKSAEAPPVAPPPKPPLPQKPEVDPLKKTHAEIFKQLRDEPEGVQHQEGALSGSRAGTAAEAKGDPYILSLIDQIGSAWTLPTTLKESELAELSADVCLTIDLSGALTGYRFLRRSGNSQLDGSLEATLSTIHKLPAPPERWQEAASRGKLCPTFSKQ